MAPKATVLCLGDSHTFGSLGGAWVLGLSKAIPELRFVNAGVNGIQAANVYASLKSRLDSVPVSDLAAITLLIGTNDCMLSLADDGADYVTSNFYRFYNCCKGPADVGAFKGHLESILTAIADYRQQHPGAQQPVKLLVVTLPPIGENLESRANKLVDEFNAAIHKVVQCWTDRQSSQRALQRDSMAAATNEAGAGPSPISVTLMDLNTQCKAAITRHYAGHAAASQEGNDDKEKRTDGGAACGPSGTKGSVSPAPKELSAHFLWNALAIVTCGLRRHLLGVSYDRQSQLGGTVVLTPDCIHLNDTGGRMLQDLMEPELRPLAVAQ